MITGSSVQNSSAPCKRSEINPDKINIWSNRYIPVMLRNIAKQYKCLLPKIMYCGSQVKAGDETDKHRPKQQWKKVDKITFCFRISFAVSIYHVFPQVLTSWMISFWQWLPCKHLQRKHKNKAGALVKSWGMSVNNRVTVCALIQSVRLHSCVVYHLVHGTSTLIEWKAGVKTFRPAVFLKLAAITDKHPPS